MERRERFLVQSRGGPPHFAGEPGGPAGHPLRRLDDRAGRTSFVTVTLAQLRAFLAVARLGSYTRAAERLYLTQPGVLMQVRSLERAVEEPLFERSGRGLRLTPAGQDLLPYAQQICELADEIQALVGDLKGLRRGHVSVCAVSTAGAYVLPPILGAFRREYPGITVHLEVINRSTLHRRLVEGECGLAVMGRPPEDIPCVAEPFLPDEIVLIASPDHRLVGVSRVPVSRLREEVFVMREKGSGTRLAFEEFCRAHQIQPIVGFELDDTSAVKEAVAAGLGIAPVSCHALQMELKLGRLAVLDVEGLPIRRQWYVVHRANRRLGRAASAFREFLLGWSSRGASFRSGMEGDS